LIVVARNNPLDHRCEAAYPIERVSIATRRNELPDELECKHESSKFG